MQVHELYTLYLATHQKFSGTYFKTGFCVLERFEPVYVIIQDHDCISVCIHIYLYLYMYVQCTLQTFQKVHVDRLICVFVLYFPQIELESDREKYVAEQEMKRKIADARRSETELLRDLLKQREESLAQAKQSAEMCKENFQALCGEWFL